MKVKKKVFDNTSIRSWKVPSKSNKGVFYTVRMFKNGQLVCDCMSFKECSHIKIIKVSISL